MGGASMPEITPVERGYPEYTRSENRYDMRVPLPFIPIVISYSSNYVLGAVKDVSRAGVMVQMLENLSEGNTVKVDFTLPESTINVKCRSKIVWSRRLPLTPDSIAAVGGLRFLDIDLELAREIDYWVASRGSIVA
jgi:hypothetical protein